LEFHILVKLRSNSEYSDDSLETEEEEFERIKNEEFVILKF